MTETIYRVLWILIHWLVDVVERIYWFGVEICELVNKLRQTDDGRDDRQLIERSVLELSKLPKHLAVVLNLQKQRDANLRLLSKLVCWALNSQVNFISFYDYKGNYAIYLLTQAPFTDSAHTSREP